MGVTGDGIVERNEQFSPDAMTKCGQVTPRGRGIPQPRPNGEAFPPGIEMHS